MGTIFEIISPEHGRNLANLHHHTSSRRFLRRISRKPFSSYSSFTSTSSTCHRNAHSRCRRKNLVEIHMMTPAQAHELLSRHFRRGQIVSAPLQQAAFRVLAQDLVSPCDLPRFTSSAMDGYAIHTADISTLPGKLKVVGTIAAGEASSLSFCPGETIRIMTGAMLPESAAAVIPQEEVRRLDLRTIAIEQTVCKGENLRFQWEEVKTGTVVMQQGKQLLPGVLAHLASLGIFTVPVYTPPRILIIPTGNELVQEKKSLPPGKIFESSSFALCAALQEFNVNVQVLAPAADDREKMRNILEEALPRHDILLITGGVSDGAYDVVKEAAQACGVETVFWKVAQKPGKPLYVGKKNRTILFGFPGNPAASLLCLYEYVRPYIRYFLGFKNLFLHEEKAWLTRSLQNTSDRTLFLR